MILRDGRKLTEELAEDLAEETVQQARKKNLIPGGKSLSGDGSHSPSLRVRLPKDLKDDLDELADRRGKSTSSVARDAITQYVAQQKNVS